ncbi:MAG: response regulator [Lachnospiraceae bacterium]|nr:response regulator [Lachnospiraceae bacterium]
MEEKGLYQPHDRNDRNRFALSQEEQYRQAVLSNAILVYNINLTKNLIEDEIYETVKGKQIPLISMAGFTLPCNFDAFSRTWAENYVDSETRKTFSAHFNREYLLKTYEQGTNEVEFEFRSKLGLGIYKNLRNTIFLIKDRESGDLIARCNVKNISAEKAKERKLHQYEQMFVNAAADIYTELMQVDMENWETIRISTQNKKFTSENVGNWEAFQEKLLTFVHPSDKEEVRAAYCRQKLESMNVGEKFVQNYKGVSETAEGEERYFSSNIIISETDGHRFVTIFTMDNTSAVENERKQKELIEDALFQAKQANKAKSIFLSNMSHDIRTPMNAIIGFTTLASTHIDNKEQVKDYLAKIMSSSNHLLSLINDVLDMSRIESGKIHLEETECGVSEIIHELQSILQADIKSKQLDFVVDMVDVFDENVLCDKLRLNQILLNLLSNAIKYTDPGGSIRVRITEKEGAPKGSANYEIRVKDTGIGMSREFMEHIFEPFEREKNTTVSGIQGSGLGMSITKGIVEMMGGTISVCSEKGQGTEFIVNLTLKLAGNSETEIRLGELDKTEQNRERFKGKRLLLTEDNELNREIAGAILSEAGFIVEEAENGAVSIEMLKKAGPGYYDLVLMDVQMPVMDGYQATEAIRALEDKKLSKILIIAMTANAFEEDKKKAMECGMNAHIAKPINVDTLLTTLAQLL